MTITANRMALRPLQLLRLRLHLHLRLLPRQLPRLLLRPRLLLPLNRGSTVSMLSPLITLLRPRPLLRLHRRSMGSMLSPPKTLLLQHRLLLSPRNTVLRPLNLRSSLITPRWGLLLLQVMLLLLGVPSPMVIVLPIIASMAPIARIILARTPGILE